MTPHDRENWLLKAGSERYVDTRLRLGKYMSQGGQTPGVNYPSREQLLSFLEGTDKPYWMSLWKADPQEAQSQIDQWKAAK